MATGTANRGYDYEDLVAAYITLKLLKDPYVSSFSIELNSERHKKFEDLYLTLIRKSKPETFAFQLKHREPNKDVLDAKSEFTRVNHGKEKNFNIDGYRKVSSKFDDNCHLVLFTNVTFMNLENIEPYEKTACKPFEAAIFDGNCFKVKETRCFSKNDKTFFEKFVIASSQKNAPDMEKAIISIFEEDFHSTKEKAICFHHFFHELRSGDYSDTRICRDGVILKLIELLLFDYKIVPNNQANGHKSNKIFEEITNSHDITVLPKTLIKDAKDHWIQSDVCLTEAEKDLASKLKLTQIIDEQKNICYFFGKPVLLDISTKSEETVLALLPLIKSLESIKINLVLLGKQCDHIIDKIDKHKSKVFKDLVDVKKDTKLYDRLTSQLQISMQGRKPTTLKILKETFNIDLEKYITADDVFSLLKGNTKIGNDMKELPDCHISRNLLKNNITSRNLADLCKDNELIIHCNNSEEAEAFKQFLTDTKINIKIVVNVGNKEDKPPEKNVVTIDYNSHCDNNSNCSHLKLSKSSFEWINKAINPTTSAAFQQQVNILCGERGAGKTTMMQVLAQNCPQSFWAVPVPVPLFQEAIFIFQENRNTDKVLEMLLSSTTRKDLDAKISKHLFDKQKVVFFFDGINELSRKTIDVAKTVIREVAKKDYKIWISSDLNLKDALQKELKTAYSFSIEEVSPEDQKKYISKRLEKANMPDLSNKIFEEEKYQELSNMFKDPLLLFIWTEILKNYQNANCINELTIKEMYTQFIEENFKHNLKKICEKTDGLKTLIKACENYYIQNFQSNALNICLEPTDFNLLKVNTDEKFIQYIKEENDIYGLITVDTSNKLSFIHYTFAEYFAAMWIFENFDKIPSNKKNFIMQPKYKGIRRFLDEMLSQDHPLHMAVLSKNLEKVKQYVKEYQNDKDKWGRTAMHLASSTGCEHAILSKSVNIYNPATAKNDKDKILQYLLDNTNLDPLERDSLFKWNSFEYADATHNLASIECLSAKRPMKWNYLQNCSKNLFSLISHCVSNGYQRLLKAIIRVKGIKSLEDQEMPWLHLALQNEQIETARFLIDSDFNLEAVDIHGQTAIHVAANWGHCNLVEVLLDKGLNIEAKNSSKRTPLQLATTRGHQEVVKLLVSKGAEVDTQDIYERTPLQKAAYRGYREIVQFLVEKEAQVNHQNKNQRTALHRASETGYVDTVKYLIENKANPNLCDKAKRTPLYMAAQEGRVKVVEFFVKLGVNILQKNEDEKTPRQIATERGHTDVVNILQEAEKNWPNLPRANSFQGDDLHKAAYDGDLETLKNLIEGGKSIEEVDDSKETVLHVASSQGHDQIVRYLLKKNANTSAKMVSRELRCI